ncbi:MAG: ImmA/IrrE family metallo-endopeptidase [Actinomycetes bacterium]
MSEITWTHPSVLRVLEQEGAQDPITWTEHRARGVSLTAMERGWEGPPYDSFQLADALDIEVVARQDLDDARLVAINGRPRIEFNPQRRPARIRFSMAHEIGHFLFEDYAERTRYRDANQRRSDDWQLEMLCNIAAAELLMPAGALPINETDNLDLVRLLGQRARFGVSTEALLRRALRLTSSAAAMFAGARVNSSPKFRIDYLVGSRAWRPSLRPGDLITSTVLSRCTAVGYSEHSFESWNSEYLRVQAVGVPPYPGDTFPRIVGILDPADNSAPAGTGIRYIRGDASDPHPDGAAVIAHVVNDKAQRWGGRGFAASLMERFPESRDSFASWPIEERRLGAVHFAAAAPAVWIASMVAQAGYGALLRGKPRLRMNALREALERVAHLAKEQGATVHMPLIGTGQGGTPWPRVRDLILEELAERRVPVTVYLLPDAPMPDEVPDEEQLTLL